MTIALPIAVGGHLVGTAVFVARDGTRLLFASCLHLLGETGPIQIVTPPHGGNCRLPQTYPLDAAPAIEAVVGASDPFSDLAILIANAPEPQTPPPPVIVASAGLLPVGSEVVILGYPFAPLGSLLETWTSCFVSALAQRRIMDNIGLDEVVLTAQSHPGSSGSAVVGKRDGVLYGILRGALAPPEVLRIGDIPIATDTSVTFASSAHALTDLIAVAMTTTATP